MASKHLFRAYRMKFDEWGLRKYKPRKRLLSQDDAVANSSRELAPGELVVDQSSTSTILQSANTEGMIDAEPDPTETCSVDVLLDLIHAGTNSSVSVLDTLLRHWQPGSEWKNALLSYFQDPEFNKWVAIYPGPATPAVFKLIEDFVPENEQFALTKLLLETDLACMNSPDHFQTPWQGSWYQVCTAEDWVEAKELLYEDGLLSTKAGVFLDCAPVVIAERLLSTLSIQLEGYTDELDAGAKHECSVQYQDILYHFRHSKYNISPYFYKFVLQVNFDEKSNNSQDWEVWAEYRQKYIRLKASEPESPEERVFSPDDSDVGTEQIFETLDQRSLSSSSSPPTIGISHIYTQPSTTFTSNISTRKSAEILVKKWKLLTGFEALRPLCTSQRRLAHFVFSPITPSSENLFDVIVGIVETEDLIAFVKSLLVAFTAALAKGPSPSWLLEWWCLVYASPTWEKFQDMLNNQQVAEHLERCMSLAAAKTFTDAAISLVGEELLSSLKNGMVAARQQQATASSVAAFRNYALLQDRYMEILGSSERGTLKQIGPGFLTY